MTPVGEALAQAGYHREASRAERCGEKQPLYCAGCGGVRQGVYRCDLGVCVGCARRKSARLVAAWSQAIGRVPRAPGYAWALLTLTLRRDATPLRDQVARILKHWRAFRGRLRRRCDRGGTKLGGFFSVEIAGAVHLHVLAYMPYIPQAWLSTAWGETTGGSPIVDVRAVRGATADALREVVKYIGKAVGHEVDRSIEIWCAMRGRQIHRPWGVACGSVDVIEPPAHPCEACGATVWWTAEAVNWLDRRATPVLASGP